MKNIKEKISQSIEILNELDIDLWLTLCRESDSVPDPVSNLIVGKGACWLSGYFISKSGDTTVLVGQADAPDFERSGLYKNVVTYSEDVGKEVVKILRCDHSFFAFFHLKDSQVVLSTAGGARWSKSTLV